MRRFFSKSCLLCAQPHMPAFTDPCNMFEVTVPPLLGQDQSFSFTFLPASPGPVVSRTALDNSTVNLYLSDSENLHGPTSSIPHPSNPSYKAREPPTCFGWRLANSCSRHTTRAEHRNHTIRPYGRIRTGTVTGPSLTNLVFKRPYLVRAVYHIGPDRYG